MNKLGVMIVLTAGTDILPEMKKAKEIGCECCQLCVWDPTLYTDLLAEEQSLSENLYSEPAFCLFL